MVSAASPNKIFISYSHKDAMLANGIARFLERRGFNIWIDHARIKARDRWASSVNEAIDAADLIIGILTADSVRRPQVIRELDRALDKKTAGGKPPLLLCVVGRIHDSWFYDQNNESCRRVIDYLHKYQRITFNAHADVTMDLMEELLSCVTSEELVSRRRTPAIDDASLRLYVNPAGMPKKAQDRRGTRFYKVYNDAAFGWSPATSPPACSGRSPRCSRRPCASAAQVHSCRNVLAKVPARRRKRVAAQPEAIHAQESLGAGLRRAVEVARELETSRLADAARVIHEGVAETPAYARFPMEHWRRVRTNNGIERLNREVKRRTNAVGSFPDGRSAMMLAAARCKYVADGNWGKRRYLDISLLDHWDERSVSTD